MSVKMEVDAGAPGVGEMTSSDLTRMETDDLHQPIPSDGSVSPPPYPSHFLVDAVAVKALNLLPEAGGKCQSRETTAIAQKQQRGSSTSVQYQWQ